MNVKEKWVSFILVVLLCVGVLGSAAALTTREKENQYAMALEELEAYLDNTLMGVDAAQHLKGIMADFDELGNYSFSHELYCYAFILLKAEEEDYADWHTVMYLDQLNSNDKLIKYLNDNDDIALAAPAALEAYYNARKAEHEADLATAISEYKKCLSFFDAAKRQENLMEGSFAAAYKQGEKLMGQGKYEEAYAYFAQCRPYKDAEGCISFIIKQLGYDPGMCGSTHTWLEATYEAPKTCSVCGKTEGEPLHRTVAGDYITFGAYEQDNNTANGKEPIEWIVLDVDNEANRALVISRYGLDAHRFDVSVYQGWDKSEIRSWLNSTFLNEAFTAEEQKAIATTTVKTGNNDEWAAFEKKKGWSYDNVSGGADTQDKVFLLSLEEAMAYGGYSTLADFYYNGTDKMKAVPTKYAVAQGAYPYEGSDSNYMLNGTGCCWWWLRSPGCYGYCASEVISDGRLHLSDVSNTLDVVRPAFWLNLDSIIP